MVRVRLLVDQEIRLLGFGRFNKRFQYFIALRKFVIKRHLKENSSQKHETKESISLEYFVHIAFLVSDSRAFTFISFRNDFYLKK